MTCELKIVRFIFTPESTIGQLYFNGALFGYTLEDFDRDLSQNTSLEDIKKIKVPGKTAIPIGTYKMIISESKRFSKDLPLLLDVPGFSGVRIHSGNKASDSEGCILVGSSFGRDVVNNSRETMRKLMGVLETCKDTQVIIIKK